MKGIIITILLAALFLAALIFYTREIPKSPPQEEAPHKMLESIPQLHHAPSPVQSFTAPVEHFDQRGWFVSYEKAASVAGASRKLLLVDFVPYEDLFNGKYRQVYDDHTVAGLLDRFVRVRLPVSDAGRLLGVPATDRRCVTFIDWKGNILRMLANEVPAGLMAEAMTKALEYAEGKRRAPEELRNKVSEMLDIAASGEYWSVRAARNALVKLGEEITPALMDELWSGSAIERSLCVYALGELGGTEVGKELSISLLDLDDEVAAAAAAALGKVGETSAIPLLIAAISPERLEVCVEVITALGRLRAREAVPHIVELLDAPDHSLKLAALMALGSIGDSTGEEKVIGLLDHEDPAIVRGAIIALGFMKSTKSVERLGKILFDETISFDLRHMATHALTRIGSPDAVGALVQGLKMEVVKDPMVRACCAEGLGPTMSSDAVLPLMNSLDTDEDATVRALAARSLGEIGDRKALPLLKKVAEKDNEVVSFHAKGAILLLGEDVNRTFIMERLRSANLETSEDVLIFSGAAFFAGKLRMRNAVPSLIESLDTYQPFVVRSLTTALTEITGHEVILVDEFDRKEVVEVKRLWERWWEKNKQSY